MTDEEVENAIGSMIKVEDILTNVNASITNLEGTLEGIVSGLSEAGIHVERGPDGYRWWRTIGTSYVVGDGKLVAQDHG